MGIPKFGMRWFPQYWKESKMLVITGQNYESILVGDKAKTMVADVCDTNGRLRITAPLPNVRKEKVLTVRQPLTQGKYDLNGRLDVVLDRLLEDIIAGGGLSDRSL